MAPQLVHCPPPPPEVLAAFSVPRDTNITPIDGGQRQCYRAGEVVFKHFTTTATEEAEWSAALMLEVRQRLQNTSPHSFRIPLPMRCLSNTFVFQEWTCTEFVSGTTIPHRTSNPEELCEPGVLRSDWIRLLKACREFHSYLRPLVSISPSFVGTQKNRWTFAHKVAWGEEHYFCKGTVATNLLKRLWNLLEKLTGNGSGTGSETIQQLVHGDMSGNVLFDPDSSIPPAIIDFTPHWRSVAWAEALITADAILWYGEGQNLADVFLADNGNNSSMVSLLVRALIFRTVSVSIRESDVGLGNETETAGFIKAVELVERMSSI